MPATTIDVREAQTRLGELVSLAAAGTEVILTEDDRPVARLVAVAERPAQRVAGLHPGAIQTTADFDDPLEDSFWTGTE